MWKGFIHDKALGGRRYYCAQQLVRGFSTEEWNSHSFHNHLWLKCHLGSIDLSFWNDPRSKQKVKTQVTTLTLQSKVRSICHPVFMRKRGSNDTTLKWSSPCSRATFLWNIENQYWEVSGTAELCLRVRGDTKSLRDNARVWVGLGRKILKGKAFQSGIQQ